MSERPTGTSMDDDRLLALREGHAESDAEESTYAVVVTDLVERMELSADALVDWNADERDETPMLVFGPISEDEVADAAYPRRLYETDGEVFVPVPDSLLRTDPGDGLGLDLASYDDGNPLLFEAIGTDSTVGLVPARFGDGTPYGREPRPDAPEDSDPVAEGVLEREGGDPSPRPETLDAPIDPDLVERAIAETDVVLDDLAPVLEGIRRRSLVGEAESVSDRPPLTVDERAVCLVDDAWSTAIPAGLEAEVDEVALEAAKSVHERQAERLIDRAGAEEYRSVRAEYDAVVTDERDTAEWEVASTEDGG